MLSCKEFVNQSSKIVDNEELSLSEKISFKVHVFLCHHCKRYLKQAKTTVAVANKLVTEHAPDFITEKGVADMKEYSTDE